MKMKYFGPKRPPGSVLQLKNMVNQLWASREGGAKRFESGDGVRFGWAQILGVWEREKARRDADHVRMVKGLLESHIERDAWTKLNVKPAKIMQVSIKSFSSNRYHHASSCYDSCISFG